MPATLSIFSRFIEALSVPHTSNYTEEIYQENPYKHTLYGLSILLKKYKVDNFAIRVDDKHELMKGGVPFIAEVSDDLVIVTSINKAQVKYDWYGEIVTKSLDEFLHIWTGVVLFASPNEAFQEQNYEEHRKLQNVQKGMRYAFLFSVVVLLVYGEYATILRHFDEAKQKLEHYDYVREMLSSTIPHAKASCSITEYLKHDGLHKMQIGCGHNLIDGWLNTDLQPTYGATFLDVMQRFPMPDACMDVVFAEHLIEEYPVQKLDGMFQEIHRVLRPNGIFRLTFFTSDHMLKMMSGSASENVCDEYVSWALRNHGNEKIVLSMSDEAQRNMAYTIFLRRMSDIMLYGFATIQELLLRNGFSKVSSYKLGVSNNDVLRHVEMHKAYSPQTIYQFEVATIEAIKRA